MHTVESSKDIISLALYIVIDNDIGDDIKQVVGDTVLLLLLLRPIFPNKHEYRKHVNSCRRNKCPRCSNIPKNKHTFAKE